MRHWFRDLYLVRWVKSKFGIASRGFPQMTSGGKSLEKDADLRA
jgi:hypothetical protein